MILIWQLWTYHIYVSKPDEELINRMRHSDVNNSMGCTVYVLLNTLLN